MSKRNIRPQYYPHLGSISTGTLNPDDLVPIFLDHCDMVRLTRDERKTVREIRKRDDQEYDCHCGSLSPGRCSCQEQWQEDRAEDLAALYDILDSHAKPYTYFGSIDGDGADIGFWISMDSLNEAIREGKQVGKGEYVIDDGAYRVQINDRGNITLFHGGREVWGAV